jgi:CrcB protein
MNVLLVCLGGAAGASARYLIKAYMVKHEIKRISFPFATLTVNFLGAFILGMLISLGTPHNLYILLGEGFCGAFTTFSTFSYENAKYLKEKKYSKLIAFISVSLIWCILAYWMGVCVADFIKFH